MTLLILKVLSSSRNGPIMRCKYSVIAIGNDVEERWLRLKDSITRNDPLCILRWNNKLSPRQTVKPTPPEVISRNNVAFVGSVKRY